MLEHTGGTPSCTGMGDIAGWGRPGCGAALATAPVPPPWGPPAPGAAGEQITDERDSVTYEVREQESVCFAATQMLNARMTFSGGGGKRYLRWC